MKVLLTGGAGYIGSVTARALEVAGHEPIVLDSLVTGPRAFVGDRTFYEGDVADPDLVRKVVADHRDLAHVIHFAARTVVPESVARPHLYYTENVVKSLALFENLRGCGLERVVFSSSASVYSGVGPLEVTEQSPTAPGSPYARTKLMTEMMLEDLARAGDLRSVRLRYFNPVGADPELRSGVHAARPTHVLGQLTAAALGSLPRFTLTGTDFDTVDGTGLRDYVHVWDLALAHVRTVEQFDRACGESESGSTVLNLGTGRGITVRQLVGVVEEAAGRAIEVVEAPRRPGDQRGAFANVDQAARVLGWRARLGIDDAVRSELAWMRTRDSVLTAEPRPGEPITSSSPELGSSSSTFE